ncbi:MAG TPA: hypothetical protein VN366_10095 [Feifaniaceae bacterium]|nr:hypothetical protein [Feifaniaceae bacterium]
MDSKPIKLPDGQTVVASEPPQTKRYRLYDKIKISRRGMDLVIVAIIGLLLLALILGIALGRG